MLIFEHMQYLVFLINQNFSALINNMICFISTNLLLNSRIKFVSIKYRLNFVVVNVF